MAVGGAEPAGVARLLALGLFGVCCAVVALALAGADLWPGAVVGFGAAMLFFLAATFVLLTRRPCRRAASGVQLTEVDGRTGLVIRYSTPVFVVLVLLVVDLAVIGAAGAVGFGAAVAETPWSLVGALLCWLFVAVALVFPAQVVCGRRRPGAVVLSEDGIWQRGMSFVSAVPWHAVVEVRLVDEDRTKLLVVAGATAEWERRAVGVLWRVDALPLTPILEIDFLFCRVDPALLGRMIRFYRDNPRCRAELGTRAALRRAHEDVFDPPRGEEGRGGTGE